VQLLWLAFGDAVVCLRATLVHCTSCCLCRCRSHGAAPNNADVTTTWRAGDATGGHANPLPAKPQHNRPTPCIVVLLQTSGELPVERIIVRCQQSFKVTYGKVAAFCGPRAGNVNKFITFRAGQQNLLSLHKPLSCHHRHTAAATPPPREPTPHPSATLQRTRGQHTNCTQHLHQPCPSSHHSALCCDPLVTMCEWCVKLRGAKNPLWPRRPPTPHPLFVVWCVRWGQTGWPAHAPSIGHARAPMLWPNHITIICCIFLRSGCVVGWYVCVAEREGPLLGLVPASTNPLAASLAVRLMDPRAHGTALLDCPAND
jgi:hypothetical protein